MNIQKTLALMALLVTNNACQKNQDQTSETVADTISIPAPEAVESIQPKEGYIWCLQSQKMFSRYDGGLVATVYKDSMDVCVPCTMVIADLAKVPAEYEYENAIPVKTDSHKIPAEVNTYDLSYYAQQLAKDCEFEKAKGKAILIEQRRHPVPPTPSF